MRPFTIVRFCAYGVILTLGVLHLVGRSDAAAQQTRGPWISGRTAQWHDAVVRLDGSRLVEVEMGWHGRCSNGLLLNKQYGVFMEPRTGRFTRRGPRFSQSYTFSAFFDDDGRPYVLRGRVLGITTADGARGTAEFSATYDDHGREVVCKSGAIAWSAPS